MSSDHPEDSAGQTSRSPEDISHGKPWQQGKKGGQCHVQCKKLSCLEWQGKGGGSRQDEPWGPCAWP